MISLLLTRNIKEIYGEWSDELFYEWPYQIGDKSGSSINQFR